MATAAIMGGLALTAVPAAFAQTNAPSPPPAHQGGMMQGGMSGQGMPGMMNEEMQQKMSRMMDNCNRMMESMQNKGGLSTPTTPNKG